MEQQQIKVFIDAMSASDLDEMEFSQDGWSLRLSRRAPRRGAAPLEASEAVEPSLDAMPDATTLAAEAATATPPRAPAPVGPAGMSETPGALEELVAPLYGVVYLRQAPGEPPYVTLGQAVTAGQTLCVIEAMKTFVEVRAEADGTVCELLVESGQEVDAGQVLLRFA